MAACTHVPQRGRANKELEAEEPWSNQIFILASDGHFLRGDV